MRKKGLNFLIFSNSCSWLETSCQKRGEHLLSFELLRSGLDIYINILSVVGQFPLKNIPKGREEMSQKLRWAPQLMIETAILIFFNLCPKASFASYNFSSVLKEVLMRKFLLEAFFFFWKVWAITEASEWWKHMQQKRIAVVKSADPIIK